MSKASFKELILSDIKNVFFNPEEYGEKHIVDGTIMTIIIDGLEVVERSKKQAEHGRIDGIYEKQMIIYVTKKEFGRLPSIGRQLTLDKSIYLILDAIDEGGIYSITLGAKKSQ